MKISNKTKVILKQFFHKQTERLIFHANRSGGNQRNIKKQFLRPVDYSLCEFYVVLTSVGSKTVRPWLSLTTSTVQYKSTYCL